MKHIKLLLVLVSVVTIIGGALAFKVQEGNTSFIKLYKRAGPFYPCTAPTTIQGFVLDQLGDIRVDTLSTTTVSGACLGVTLRVSL